MVGELVRVLHHGDSIVARVERIEGQDAVWCVPAKAKDRTLSFGASAIRVRENAIQTRLIGVAAAHVATFHYRDPSIHVVAYSVSHEVRLVS